ncbi:phosphotransferase [Arthrobacter sp.]|uniref:phosphotransferase enzyme family protein n=1 Tax=Arthrobacter sp. TaxID=1667 RepID=UPI002811C2F9|nr:phosphotransferase [Arthrobacter sp.]
MHIKDAHDIARAALAPFGLDPDSRVEFIKYRENHVFRAIDSTGSSTAIRLHRPGYRDEEELRSEFEFLRALRDAGVEVPEVIPTLDGDLFTLVQVGEHSRQVSAQRWVEDASPFGDIESVLAGRHNPEPAAFAQIGALLGRLHAAAVRMGIPAGFRRSAWDAAGLAGPSPLWGDPRLLTSLTTEERDAVDRALPALHEQLSALPTDSSVFGIIHADASPENLLETAHGVVLIDFDDFGTGWFVFDLVTAIFHHALHPRYLDYEQALIAGYTQERPLSKDEIAVWDAFMLARGLTYLAWAAERPGDPASDFVAANVAPWVAQLADTYDRGQASPWRRPAIASPGKDSQ